MNPIIMDEVNTHTTAELDILQAKLGETADTGGTEKMGTLFAKLNALINVIAPSSGHEEFTTPGTHTFTVPGNVKSLNITVIGAGGGGGNGANTGVFQSTQTVNHCTGSWEETIYTARYGYGGSRGGNGATVTKTISVNPGATLTLVVGAGGNAGQAGGASSITNHATASGGSAGSSGGVKTGTYSATSVSQAVNYLSYAGLSNYGTSGSTAPGGGGSGGAGGSTYYLDQKTTGTSYGVSGGSGKNGKIIIEW